jgi:hypothetical protein
VKASGIDISMMEVLDIMEVDLGLDTAWVVVVVDEEKVLVTAALDWLDEAGEDVVKVDVETDAVLVVGTEPELVSAFLLA